MLAEHKLKPLPYSVIALWFRVEITLNVRVISIEKGMAFKRWLEMHNANLSFIILFEK